MNLTPETLIFIESSLVDSTRSLLVTNFGLISVEPRIDQYWISGDYALIQNFKNILRIIEFLLRIVIYSDDLNWFEWIAFDIWFLFSIWFYFIINFINTWFFYAESIKLISPKINYYQKMELICNFSNED